MVVETGQPPAKILPFPPRRQPPAAEIASQRDAVSDPDLGNPIRTYRLGIQPSVAVDVVAARDVVAEKVVDVAVEAKVARTVIPRLVAR